LADRFHITTMPAILLFKNGDKNESGVIEPMACLVGRAEIEEKL